MIYSTTCSFEHIAYAPMFYGPTWDWVPDPQLVSLSPSQYVRDFNKQKTQKLGNPHSRQEELSRILCHMVQMQIVNAQV